MTLPSVSIVVPSYNEEDNVAPLCTAVRDALTPWPHTWELVFVDDGSTDHTVERAQAEGRADDRVRVVRMALNSGQTLAMAAGFAAARGGIIVSMDGDLQNDPRDIPLLVERLGEGFDVVCGWRKDRQDAWLSRTLPSKIANRLIAWMTGIRIHDNGCSLKAYRAGVIRSLNLYSDMHRFLPALSSMTGARIAEVVVRHHPRRHGTSKYGIMRTFRVMADIVTIKMITRYAGRPAVWFAGLSLPWLALAVLAAGLWLAELALGVSAGIVLPSLSVMFFYLFGGLLSLAIVSETFLHHADRSHLRRLADTLTVATDLARLRAETAGRR